MFGLKEIVRRALAEDIGRGDWTTSIVPLDALGRAVITAKAAGRIAGLPVAEAVFRELDSGLVWQPLVSEGAEVIKGLDVAEVRGRIVSILQGERVALNFLQRASGIATLTAQYVAAVAGTKARIADTRKTVPGLRLLDKYAVRVGGGTNHRMGLDDAVLIKDNHIVACGGIRPAVAALRRSGAPFTLQVEVEVTSLGQLQEAMECGVQAVLLDNMTWAEMRQAVELAQGRVLLEASGGITLETVRAVAETGVDIISVGALTHSVRALDLSLNLD
ncbi:MAG: carboxylating nicotinate-nucleotide diphosphorylase [Clostridia bacterium]|nr:MAG: carboxylating nicotinate-nucleotide diphosphorylase [Clostridia bacterium]